MCERLVHSGCLGLFSRPKGSVSECAAPAQGHCHLTCVYCRSPVESGVTEEEPLGLCSERCPRQWGLELLLQDAGSVSPSSSVFVNHLLVCKRSGLLG